MSFSRARVYQSVNYPVLESIPADASRILDIGCGGGDLGAVLKHRATPTVVGVTSSQDEAELARAYLDFVEVADLNHIEPGYLGYYDCIVCCHVLEHLHDPQRLLCSLARDCLAPNGVLIVALPNVLHWKQRLQFLIGRFRYTEGGIMDNTHIHFYDWDTAAMMLVDSGYRIETRIATGILPLSHILKPIGKRLDRLAVKLWPRLFGWQFIICARPEPSLFC